MTTVYIFNTTILTTVGLTYRSTMITPEQARAIVGSSEQVISAVGHDATAQIATAILGQTVPVNRYPAKMQPGDIAVCIKLRDRAQEGAILDMAQVEEIGYDLVRLDAYDERQVASDCHLRTDPEAQCSRPDAPVLAECAAALVHQHDAMVRDRDRLLHAGGFAYRGGDARGSLRAAVLTLCRETVDDVLRLAEEDAPVASLRDNLVDRLIDRLQEQGQSLGRT